MKELLALIFPREIFEQTGDGGGVFGHDTPYKLLSENGGLATVDRQQCVMDECLAYNMQEFRRKMVACDATNDDPQGVTADGFNFLQDGNNVRGARAGNAVLRFSVTEPILGSVFGGPLSMLRGKDFNQSHYWSTFPNAIPLVNDMSIEVALNGAALASNLLVFGPVNGQAGVTVPTVNVYDSSLQTYWFTPAPSYKMAGVKKVTLPIWSATTYTKACPAIAAGAEGTIAIDRMNLVSMPSLFIFAVTPNRIKKRCQFYGNGGNAFDRLAAEDFSIGANLQVTQISLTVNTSGAAMDISGRSTFVDEQLLLDWTRANAASVQ